MNSLNVTERAKVLSCLVEGNSINATCRITGYAKNTVLKLLAEVGAACAAYQDRVMRKLPCKRLQADEIWAFVGMKDRNVPAALKGTFGYGDVWTWTAIDADTKLIPCWHVAPRDGLAARQFMNDVASRLTHRVQLTTDGHAHYLRAVDEAFATDVDFAQLIKIFGPVRGNMQETRYSPGECCGVEKNVICGKPDGKEISTSYVERANLTMRMGMRRFTRLTNAFSKKLENHMHAVSLHFMHYNFCRIHKTLRVTPAMEAGLDDHVWSLEEVVMMADTMDRGQDVTVGASE